MSAGAKDLGLTKAGKPRMRLWKASIEQRLEALSDRTGDCWLWLASLDRHGYGHITVASKRLKAHRVSYETYVGPIPDGLPLDHLCRTPACIRPDHLEPVTQRVNLLRGQTVTAAKAAQTECIHGHPFNEANTGRAAPNGTRYCRTCNRASCRRRYHARKARAAA